MDDVKGTPYSLNQINRITALPEDLYKRFSEFKEVLLDLETALVNERYTNETFSQGTIAQVKTIAARDIDLWHQVIDIIATRLSNSNSEEVNSDGYLKIKQQLVSCLLEDLLSEELVLDGDHCIKTCFGEKNPIAYLISKKKAIKQQLQQTFNTSQPHFYKLINAFYKGFEYSNIGLEEVYNTAPYFETLFAPLKAIQNIRDLKSATNLSNINHALERIAKHFETGLADSSPKTYFNNNQAALMRDLNLLQSTPGSLWCSLLNAIYRLVSSCLSIFGTPSWLEAQFKNNQQITGDQYMFFKSGEMQRTKIEAHQALIAIASTEQSIYTQTFCL
jgi:hypothetical protein